MSHNEAPINWTAQLDKSVTIPVIDYPGKAFK